MLIVHAGRQGNLKAEVLTCSRAHIRRVLYAHPAKSHCLLLLVARDGHEYRPSVIELEIGSRAHRVQGSTLAAGAHDIDRCLNTLLHLLEACPHAQCRQESSCSPCLGRELYAEEGAAGTGRAAGVVDELKARPSKRLSIARTTKVGGDLDLQDGCL